MGQGTHDGLQDIADRVVPAEGEDSSAGVTHEYTPTQSTLGVAFRFSFRSVAVSEQSDLAQSAKSDGEVGGRSEVVLDALASREVKVGGLLGSSSWQLTHSDKDVWASAIGDEPKSTRLR